MEQKAPVLCEKKKLIKAFLLHSRFRLPSQPFTFLPILIMNKLLWLSVLRALTTNSGTDDGDALNYFPRLVINPFVSHEQRRRLRAFTHPQHPQEQEEEGWNVNEFPLSFRIFYSFQINQTSCAGGRAFDDTPALVAQQNSDTMRRSRWISW